MRKLEDKDLVGKTVKSIKNESVNCIELTSSDDTKLELWAEDAIFTQFGFIPGIFVSE